MKTTSFLFALVFTIVSNFAFSLDHYWVGGTGNWSTAGNWSTLGSGGAPTATLPGAIDNVIFDAAGMVATDIVTMDIPVDVFNFDFSAAPSFVLTSALPSIQVHGSLSGNGTVTFGGWTGDIVMNNNGADQIVSNGTIWNQTFRFPANTGTIQIIDDFITTGDIHTDINALIFWNVIVTFNNFFSINSAATRGIDFSGATINFEGTVWNIEPTTLTLSSALSTINANNPATITFTGGGQIYNTLISSASDLQINNDNTFSLISLAPASQLTLANGSTQFFDSLYTDCGPLVTTIYSAVGAPAQLQKTGYQNFAGSHLTVDNVDAMITGTETYSLVNSTLVNGSLGWTSSVISNYYWIAGTGSWSDGSHWSATSGGAPLGCVPAAPDNVIFDAFSGLSAVTTVTMDVPVVVNNFDFSTAPAFVLTSVLPSIEIQGDLSGNGLVTFAGWAGDINLNSTTSNVLTSNGTSWMQSFHFIGTGTVTINDDFNTTLDFYVDLGSVISNNIFITFRDFYSNVATIRSINFDNAIVIFEGTTWDVDPTTYTWTSNPSTIFANNLAVVSFTGGNQIYDTIRSLASELQINNNNVISLLSLSTSSQLTLENGSLQLIDSLDANGTCSVKTSIVSALPAPAASAQIQKAGFPDFTSSYLSIDNVDAMSPGSETYSITVSDTVNGADGWASSATSNYYWIGGTGNWSDGNHWSATSGGAPLGCIPGVPDNVIFDGLSGLSAATTVTMDVAVTVHNFDFSLAPAFVLTSVLPSIEIQGDLSGNGLVTFAGWAGDINLNSTASNVLTSNGTSWMQSFHFIGTGTVTINDDFNTTLDFYVDLGSVISNNISLTFRDFYSNLATIRSINFDNAIVNFEGTTWDVDPTTYTWTSNPSTIFSNNLAVVSFTGGNQIYDTIRSLASELQINNSNSFSLINLATSSQLTLENSSLQSIDSLEVTGSCGARTSIVSAIPAPAASAQIQKIGFSDLVASYLSVNNVDAMSPGSETYSIAQSDTTNGADGWSLIGRPFYWIGDAGNWSDGNHWSDVSGGAAIGCIPSLVDSVFFDAASFSTGGQTVLIDLQGEFKTMDWTGTTGNQTLALDSNLMSFGDVTFVSNLTVQRNLNISGIQFNNQASLFPNSSTIDCSFLVKMGIVTDSLIVMNDLIMSDTSSVVFFNGRFSTQGNKVRTGTFISINDAGSAIDLRHIDIASSDVHLVQSFDSKGDTDVTLSSSFSNLYIGDTVQVVPVTISYGNQLKTEGLTFNNVTLNFQPLTFFGGLAVKQKVTGNNTFAKFKILPGSHVYFDSLTTQTITDSLIMKGNCRDSIYIFSSDTVTFTSSNLNTTSVNGVSSECVQVSGINVVGSTVTTYFSTAIVNTTGLWDFDTTPPITSSFTADGPFCFGDTTLFTNTTTVFSGGPSDFTSYWFYNDNSTGYYLNPPTDSTWINYEVDTNQHVFNQSGDIAVELVTEYYNFCRDTVSQIVHINNASLFIASSEADTNICVGDAVTFEVTGSPSSVTFEFFLNSASQNTPSINDTLYAVVPNDNDAISAVAYENGCPSDTTVALVYNVTPLPIFSWTSSDADTSICAGDLVSFISTPAGTPYLYQYRKNGSPLTGYLANGLYSTTGLIDNDIISVIARDNLYCRDTLSMVFNVDPLPTTSMTSSIPTGSIICDQTTVTFTASGADTYEFFIDGISVAGPSATNVFVVDTLVSSEVVSVIGYNTIGGCQKTAGETFDYIITPLPAVTFESNDLDNSICSGTNVTFTAGGAGSYEFFINGGSQGASNPTTTLSTTSLSDSDEIYVTGSFSGCSMISDTIIFSVIASPTTSLVSDDADLSICAEEPVLFTGSGANNYEFFVDGISQGASSPTNTFSTNGLTNGQTVLVVGESNLCTVNQSLTFTVLAIPSVSIFSDDPDNAICQGDPIEFTGANAISYELYVNNLVVAGPQASPTFNPSLPAGNDLVYIIGTAANGCSDTSQTSFNITVTPLPTVGVTSNDIDNILCTGQSVTFTGSGSSMYQFFIDGLPVTSMSSTSTFTTSNLTNGQVISITGSTLGCTNPSLTTITNTVNPVPVVALTTNEVPDDNTFCLGSSVTFTSAGATNYQFIVNGVSQGPSSPTNTLDASSFVAGTYPVQVIGESNSCFKSVIENVTVFALPTSTLTSNDLDNIICSGTSVQYTATGGGLYQFSINGTPQGVSSPISTLNSTSLVNGDIVSVLVSSSQGCTANSIYPAITVNTTPTTTLISSDFDNQICIGENVDFTASGANTYQFFVNGVSQGVPSATAVFSSTGLTNGASIAVNGTSNNCTDPSSPLVFTVYNYPSVSLVNNGENEICVGENTNLVASGATDYVFAVNGTQIGVFGPTNTFNSALNDGDIVTVFGSTNGCVSLAPSSQSYTVNTYPTLTSNSSDIDNIICLNDLISFTASGASTYLYELNGSELQNGATSTYNIGSLADGDMITITGFNGDCTSTSDNYNFTVNSMNLDLTASLSNMICAGENVTFTATGADVYSFYLNGVQIVPFSATNTYSSSTLTDLDEVTFVAQSTTTSCQQDYDDYIIMNVIETPVISSSSSITFCEGDSVTLISNASYGNQWYLNGTPITGATDTSLTVYTSGTYSLEVTAGGVGTVWSFGLNADGTFGNGDNFNSSEPISALTLVPLDELSSGDNFVLGVTTAGDVYSWGNNGSGQLGNGTYTSSNTPILVPTLMNIKTVATSASSAMAVSNAGDVYVWGNNNLGQLGTGNTSVINFPMANASITNTDTIAGGKNHFIILKNDGTVWTVGDNSFGQLGQGNLIGSFAPIQVGGLSNIVSIGAGEYHSFAIDNVGNLYTWGNNGSGQLGLNDLTSRLVPTISPLKDIINAQGGANHSAFLSSENKVYTSGGNVYGQLGNGTYTNQLSPIEVDIQGAKMISTGQYSTLVLRTDNSVFGFGNNTEDQLSSITGLTVNTPEHISDLDGATFIEAGKSTSHVIYNQVQSCVSINSNVVMDPAPIVTIVETAGVLTTAPGISYQWYINGSIITGATSQNYTPTTTGNYSVEVTYANGCTGLSSDYFFGIANIIDQEPISIGLYPNPTTGILNLAITNYQSDETISITIMDQTGRIVRVINTPIHGNLQIDLTDTETGSYMAIIQINEYQKTIRFVKTNF
jgi:alpha-tubulin suppressor-like RCC1 family protein